MAEAVHSDGIAAGNMASGSIAQEKEAGVVLTSDTATEVNAPGAAISKVVNDAALPRGKDDAPAETTAAADNANNTDSNENNGKGVDMEEPTDTEHRDTDVHHEDEARDHKNTEHAEHEEPTDPPSKELTLEDVYNPRNLTWDELEMHLYEWEEEITTVSEYLDMRVIHKIRTGETDDWDEESEDEDEEENEEDHKKKEEKEEKKKGGSWMDRLKLNTKHADDGHKTQVEFKKGPTHYLNLTKDAAHVVEFYAPWCPHCQNYKWEYVEVADEVTRRSISPVQFHAVSCDVYYAICATYNVKGFPTILGWKQGESFDHRGVEMNVEEEIYPDMVADMLDLDLAHEAVELFDWNEEIEDPEERKMVDVKMAAQASKAARTKKAWHEQEPHTHNDRYHNAALSLAFAVKSQLFQTLTEDGSMEPKRERALLDFLDLLDWATPQSWQLRSTFVSGLKWKINANEVEGRGDLESLIDVDMKHHRSLGTEDLWGAVDASEVTWAERMKFSSESKEQPVKDDKHWTKTCTHSQPAKGFTCGLWNLFHILTIGSSKPEHELYGFHRGYIVSSHHVAETIRNFVAYFFSCDVCRTNFLKMYDGCGHDHCERLSTEIITAGDTDPSRQELALWLWEVHNSVNARLMKEAAQRQNRKVTDDETVASRFPTMKLCPDCWLDENMTTWDNAAVFGFLNELYWPTNEPTNEQFKSVIAGTADEIPANVHVRSIHADNVKPSVFSVSKFGTGSVSLFLLLAFLSLAIAAAQKKKSQRRKKFVDSRFVQKRQGYF